jgi:hypothetical protein
VVSEPYWSITRPSFNVGSYCQCTAMGGQGWTLAPP